MIKIFTFISLFLILAVKTGAGQDSIDHWEMIINAGDTWRYLSGREPRHNWQRREFDDGGWSQGPGGIGYGDNDDKTVIAPTTSLYMRRRFSVDDISVMSGLLLAMDYDDAFVAYINDIEVARANIGTPGVGPGFADVADGSHEARMYQGGQPDYFPITVQSLKSLLVTGENVLAIQVHNQSATSSDMSAIPFLCAGIADNARHYRPIPQWFSPPVQLTSSNLPIILIDTNGRTIQNDYRIPVEMVIKINPNGRTTQTSETDFAGRVNIEIRGSSSANFDKKSYGFETQDSSGANLNVSLLGLPKENDWILYGPYSDKSLLRNAITFLLARAMGQYASRLRFCELLLNGEYMGLYVLMEKIKRDKNRVAIKELEPMDITGDELTGGYIIKVDKEEGYYRGWTSLASGSSIFFQYVYPAPDIIVPEQESYIQNFLADFEQSLLSWNFANPERGYSHYIDVNSFIDALIINELSKDIDGYRFSTFMYKDRNRPLTMGPIWDYNLGYGNVDYGGEGAMNTDGWIYNTGGKRIWWWDRMMRDPLFRTNLGTRWRDLRRGPLQTETIYATIDSLLDITEEARIRNFQRWPILGVYVWPNYFVGETYEEEIEFLKNWISDRLLWMDDNMPASTGIQVDLQGFRVPMMTIYPNPFNQSTILALNLNKAAEVSMIIYDINGKQVAILFKGYHQAGVHRFVWNSENVTSGIYFCEIVVGQLRQTRKMTIVR